MLEKSLAVLCNILSQRSYSCTTFRYKLYPKSKCGITQAVFSQQISVITPTRLVGSSSASNEKDIQNKNDDLNFPEKTITVYTCENVYTKWKKDKTFRRIPKSGVFAKITYVDTFEPKESNKNPQKTVMCIHGIPGNYGVFSHLINDLSQQGIRVIVPNFPATLYLPGKHKEELFRHSVAEKTQVFKDFLKALNVNELDGIIAHSSGIYPALHLSLDPNLNVKCQALFNTGGHKKTVTMRPYWIIWTCSQLCLYNIGRFVIQKTGRFIMKHILRTPIKDDNLDGIILLAITMVNSQYWKAREQFLKIAERNLPTLYCFSEDDKVVERKLSYEVVSLLNASKENINYYNEDGKLKLKGEDLPWLKLLSFKQGSHYVFRKYPDLCSKEVIELLQKIKK